jgi:hypothetical protein
LPVNHKAGRLEPPAPFPALQGSRNLKHRLNPSWKISFAPT